MSQSERLGIAEAGDDTLVLRLSGPWLLKDGVPSAEPVDRALKNSPDTRRVAYDTQQLEDWDSGVLSFLRQVSRVTTGHGITQDRTGLPEGIRRLLDLSEAVPEKKDARRGGDGTSLLDRIGWLTVGIGASFRDTLSFIGETTLVLGQGLRGAVSYRKADFRLLLQQSSVDALPIVALVNFLLGLILGFVGAVQLQQFGAEIYVANLVGIAMVRDMSALITGIIMAGRSGAAFAAEIGSMNANQELDALQTTGISPMQFLVVPRVWALVLMMPLLTLYGDVLGILGGATVGVGMLDLSLVAYYQQTVGSLSMTYLLSGLFKGLVYGMLVAVAGCLRGMQAGRSALAVGGAATSAVVTGIVWIIAACGIFQFLSYVLGI